MKTILNFFLIFVFAMTLSHCKNDCEGTYTWKGRLWNGTKNKPYLNTKIDFKGGGSSSLFSSSVNAKDLGTVYTDEDGKFSFTYNCINEDDWSVSMFPRIGSNPPIYTVAKNQDVNETYNIPDSITLDVYFSSTNGLGNADTLYVYIGLPDNIQRLVFTENIEPIGFYKRFRMRYQDAASMQYTIGFASGIGYLNYKSNLLIPVGGSMINNIRKLEPEVNELTIYY